MSNQVVLDASALLALLNEEKGAQYVQDRLAGALISTVNLAEVVTRLTAIGMPQDEISDTLTLLGLEAAPFDEIQAYQAGFLYPVTHSLGLSLGDRACLALAKSVNLPVLTADSAWKNLDVGTQIQLIR
ncbi:MAG TPA: type II toxin-antitoxin system VapC family toxin [Anaerolineaceae bacterium]|jgi:PIN domain nuclease of toxin-antitoxin system